MRRFLALLLIVVAGTGCSGDAEAEAARVATSFYDAVSRSDGAAACRLLATTAREELESSTGAPCAEAVLSEVAGVAGSPDVTTAGTAARVRVGADTAFVAAYAEGWRVVAAGCSRPPAEDLPYDCRVQGG